MIALVVFSSSRTNRAISLVPLFVVPPHQALTVSPALVATVADEFAYVHWRTHFKC